MTPKEKATELFDKYFFPHYVWENDGYQVDEKLTYEVRKRFALIAVDEILKLDNPNTYNYLTESKENLIVELADNYWQNVKKEIEAL